MKISRRAMLAAGAASAAAVAAQPERASALTLPVMSARPGPSGTIRALQARLITLDTHLDAPMNFARPGWDIMKRQSVANDLSQVDYPRMVEGGLDGGFFAIYTPQGPVTPEGFAAARDAAMLRAVEIREMVARNPSHFELARVPEDAARIKAEKKRIVFQSIENAWPLGTDVTLLRVFHTFGVRMTGVVHFLNNQFGDSATDPKGAQWKGLSPLGRDLVAEANALGMVLDQSHASDDVFDQLIEYSKAPIMCSHSSCRAIHDHPRNLDDDRIKKLAAAGGTIQINTFSSYLVTVPPNPDRDKAMGAIFAKLHGIEALTPKEAAATVAEAAREVQAVRKMYPGPRATFDIVMQHMKHALDLVGPDHVGIGCDWDGGGGVTGMEDCAGVWKITEALVKLGYGEDDLRKIWGGNALRVLAAAEAARTAPPFAAPGEGGGE